MDETIDRPSLWQGGLQTTTKLLKFLKELAILTMDTWKGKHKGVLVITNQVQYHSIACHQLNFHYFIAHTNPRIGDRPSVFGPGFSSVPGGPDFLNRTVFSWHYYCWATAQTPNSNDPYDPSLR